MKKTGYIFLYYENNHNDCARESEPSIDHELFDDTRDIAEHAMERIKMGIEDGFVLDEDSEYPTVELIEKTLREKCHYQVTMFFRNKCNFDSYYDVVATALRVQKHKKKP